ncbi:hypothetical protein [Sphingomonas sp. IW22]|uniref:hypothetical protein n=1 Tax=Sphingomonas sp. IW22 TaxID=3242489 RepID=UPI003522F761
MFGKILTAVAATTIAAAPVVAAPANSLSVAKQVRASTVSEKSSKATGSLLFPALIGAGVVAILVVGLTNDGDELPDSN